MACLWVVCGAGRGVGKTWIARGLCERLPDASYAKHGHGDARPDKPGRLLHDLPQVERFLALGAERAHLVVESNTLALAGRGEVVIFVEGQTRGLPRRDDADQLRAAAHIVLDHDQPIARWRYVIADRVDVPTAASIVRLLQRQVERLPAPDLRIGTKVWLDLPGGHAMGKGLAQLLVQIDRHATLRKAADAAGISYRHAWDMVRTAEKHLNAPLIISRPGGLGGGGTSLTALGARLVRCYESLDAEVTAMAQRRLAELLAGEPSE